VRTRLTELLGCRHPIVQTGMGYVAGARLVAATSAAGGFGIVASATMSLSRLRDTVREIRARTDAPFGVNVRADAPDAADRIDVLIGEQVRLASFALAPDRDLIRRCADGGVLTMPSVGARRHAEKVAGWGVDAVLVQGGEGGGHTGPVPTTLLLPQVVDAVDIPVVAAGGFFDGRGLVAALAYGAAGIAMGTRFLLTSDSPVAPEVKRHYLQATLTGTVVTTRVDGVPHRVLRTPFVDTLERSGRLAALARSARHAAAFRRAAGLSWPALIRSGRAARHGRDLSWAQTLMAANTPALLRKSMVDGDPAAGVMSAGQVAGLIDDLPSCAELIDRIMKEADDRLTALTTIR
jgi:NAD(P)H-dependent flavin oxidoreductase YrpB (nitropropane dioxygenase family)